MSERLSNEDFVNKCVEISELFNDMLVDDTLDVLTSVLMFAASCKYKEKSSDDIKKAVCEHINSAKQISDIRLH